MQEVKLHVSEPRKFSLYIAQQMKAGGTKKEQTQPRFGTRWRPYIRNHGQLNGSACSEQLFRTWGSICI